MTMPPERLYLATTNPGKVAELAELLGDVWPRTQLLGRPAAATEVLEDAPDFLGNARKKAIAIRQLTGEASVADDSGLVVNSLGGRPGVHSARFAGENATDEENIEMLLRELDNSTPGAAAKFECAVVLQLPTAEGEFQEIVGRGSVDGTVATQPAGESGFGYDPVFIPNEADGRTFAQMTRLEKNSISHRGRALADLVSQLA